MPKAKEKKEIRPATRKLADLDAGERAQLRSKYSLGAPVSSLAFEYNLPEVAIRGLAKRESWVSDPVALQKRVVEKIVKVDSTTDLEVKLAALETEADRQAEIIKAHRARWISFQRDVLDPAIETQDEKQARMARTLADAIRIAQAGERLAWGLGESLEMASNGPLIVKWAST